MLMHLLFFALGVVFTALIGMAERARLIQATYDAIAAVDKALKKSADAVERLTAANRALRAEIAELTKD